MVEVTLGRYTGRTDPNEQRRKLAYAMLANATSGGPVPGVLGGLAKIGTAGVTAWGLNRMEEREKAQREEFGRALGEKIKAGDWAGAAQIDPDNAVRWGTLAATMLEKQQANERARRVAEIEAGGGQPPAAPPASVQQAPLPPAEPPVGGKAQDYQALTAKQESGGNPTITNPSTGAFGKYQFLPSTAVAVARANPDLGLPEDVRQWTPEQQDAAEKRFRQMNARQLAASMGQGFQPKPSDLRLAHYFGAGGAAGLLKLDPNTPFAQVPDGTLGAKTAEVLRVNPNLRNMRVGDLINQYRRQFDGIEPEVAQIRPLPGGKSQTIYRESGGIPQYPADSGAYDPVGATPLDPTPEPAAPVGAPPASAPPVSAAPSMPPLATPPQAPVQQAQFDPGGEYTQRAANARAMAQRLAQVDPARAAQWSAEARRLDDQAIDARRQHQGRIHADELQTQRAEQGEQRKVAVKQQEERRKAMVAARSVLDLVKNYEGKLGGLTTQDFIVSQAVTTPKMAEARAALNFMISQLRDESLLNTGVLQKGELDWINGFLTDPATMQGLLMRNEAMVGQLRQVENLIRSRMQALNDGKPMPGLMLGDADAAGGAAAGAAVGSGKKIRIDAQGNIIP